MEKINIDEFSVLKFNPFKLAGNDKLMTIENIIIKHFPELSVHEEFKLKLRDPLKAYNVLCYIFLLYQPNTPLMRYADFNVRKMEAAKFAEFKIQDKYSFIKAYQQVFNSANWEINRMIIAFLRMQGDYKFAKLMVYTEKYYSDLLNLKNEKDPGETKKIRENVDGFEKTIDTLSYSFLAGNDSKPMLVDTFLEIEFERLNLSPEEIAKKIMNKEDPLGGFSPYSKDYKPVRFTETEIKEVQ